MVRGADISSVAEVKARGKCQNFAFRWHMRSEQRIVFVGAGYKHVRIPEKYWSTYIPLGLIGHSPRLEQAPSARDQFRFSTERVMSTTLDTKQDFWWSMFKPAVLPSYPVFNINARTTCRDVLFTLDSHVVSTKYKQHPKRFLAISVLDGPAPYLLPYVMPRQTTPLFVWSLPAPQYTMTAPSRRVRKAPSTIG